ncbi:hypothetical protein [Luteimonas huabeiensis]|uniref:hypothetical protein n=1 Tax=Luteimonas huabeiensis TaxID=1244513 RepID=UPI001F2FC2F2|nr:hypothetical protein [Luteimonas huabeiensis]
MPKLASDVRDVVYLNWWVAARHAPPAPPGFRYVERDGRTPYTVLTYRHGGFGPEIAGPLRRLAPSPLQSNWRWYLQREGDAAGAPVVLFDRNVMDSALYVLGARAFSDAMQPHLSARFTHVCSPEGCATRIESGDGGAPSLRAELAAADDWGDALWAPAFGGRDAALRFLACQDEALAMTVDGRWAATRIELPVALADLRPLRCVGRVDCPRIEAFGAGAQAPFAFLLEQVPFRVVSERLL